MNILPQYILAGNSRYLLDDKQNPSDNPSPGNTTPVIQWNESFLLGWYKAEASIKLDDSSPQLHGSTYFIAFPLYGFFILVAVLFILLSIYLRVKRKI